MKKFSLIACAILFNASMPTCEAGMILSVQQVGSDVVASQSGTVNLAGLTLGGPASTLGIVSPVFSLLGIGPASDTPVTNYSGLSGPTDFGTGGTSFADLGSGDIFAIYGLFGLLYVPDGYVSGTALSGSSTWTGQTLGSLGITPGTYTWTWGSGGNADSAVLTVAGGSVPEPGTMALGLSGVLASLGAGRLRKRKSV